LATIQEVELVILGCEKAKDNGQQNWRPR